MWQSIKDALLKALERFVSVLYIGFWLWFLSGIVTKQFPALPEMTYMQSCVVIIVWASIPVFHRQAVNLFEK